MGRATRWAGAVGSAVVLAILGCSQRADEPAGPPAQAAPGGSHSGEIAPADDPDAPEPEGVLVKDARAFRGYALLSPIMSHDTSLIDTDGRTVRTWHCGCPPALGARLLENGHLLRAGQLTRGEQSFEHAGGGGRIQEFDWNGELVWDFRLCDDRHLPHHDVLKLPNGNVLVVVCERIPAADARAAGRRPTPSDADHLRADSVVEIKPTGRTTGEVVWEWRVWDHLIQEYDREKRNFGSVADHPELIDLNFGTGLNALMSPGPDRTKLQALGYVGSASAPASGGPNAGDWTHLNAVAYNPERDELAVTSFGFSEVWVIDHSTTRAEAAGHTGGKAGRGGDLLYRWGNPRAYRHGTTADQRLACPHDAHWIGRGLPGAGHLLVFNNGSIQFGDRASTLEEVDPPIDPNGRYAREAKSAFGPDRAVWRYNGEKRPTFFSVVFSGSERLPNGDTLMCLGLSGTLVEVTPAGEVVWRYASPRPPAGHHHMERSLFRAPVYAPDYPGLADKHITPPPRP
jgi:hypothetical protein